MSQPSTLQVENIQRLVLHNAPGVAAVLQVIVFFPPGASGRRFLCAVCEKWPVTAARPKPHTGALLCSLGLTYRGLERLHMPPQVLGLFRARARAFSAGAAPRSAEHLGDTGASAARQWDACFGIDAAHALIVLHSTRHPALWQVEKALQSLADEHGVQAWTLRGTPLGAPDNEQGQWVHFGFRDGLSRVAVQECHVTEVPLGMLPVSTHKAGEFVLGHVNDHGFNPWALPTAQQDVRTFFRDGSFGVLRQMEQDVAAFEDWVQVQATRAEHALRGVPGSPTPASWPDYIKAKVCGRWPDGRRFEAAGAWSGPGQALGHSATADFDYSDDLQAHGCPFGAHVRRMNPRLLTRADDAVSATMLQANEVAHIRRRPLMRRGRPYGPAYVPGENPPIQRGLLGLFFCASLEDQFEHLLGQWAERPVLGVDDPGSAKDPLIGEHDGLGAPFVMPLANSSTLSLDGLRAFVRTRGTLYAFFPSLLAMKLLLDNAPFRDEDQAPLEP